jgi:hypothetical protein
MARRATISAIAHHVPLERRSKAFYSQIIQLVGVHDSTDHNAGLIASDTDDRRRQRVFVGHDKEGVARVALMDGNGRPRIMLQVSSEGNPSLSFLDGDGHVINQIGPTRPQ